MFFTLKGNVSVISSETADKDGNALFTTVPLKASSMNSMH